MSPGPGRRFGIPIVLGAVVGAVMASAVAFAVIPDSVDVIHGCWNKTSAWISVADAPSSASRVAKVWRRAWTMAPAGTRLARPAAR